MIINTYSLSHNDLHPGNIMKLDLSENATAQERMKIYFLDFDNAAFGYRAFDILYFLLKMPTVRCFFIGRILKI